MEYEYPINMFDSFTQELSDYQTRLSEISSTLKSLKDDILEVQDGAYAKKIVEVYEILIAKVNEVEDYVFSLLLSIEEYGIEMDDVLLAKNKYMPIDLNLSEFIKGCQQGVDKLNEIKKKLDCYSTDQIEGKKNKLINELNKQLSSAKKEKKELKVKRLKEKLEEVSNNSFTFNRVIEELHNVGFQKEIEVLENIIIEVKKLEKIEVSLTRALINIPEVIPSNLMGGDVFNVEIGETGESLKTINSKAGKIKEERRKAKGALNIIFGALAWAVPVFKVPSIIKLSCEGLGALTALSMARDSFSEGKPIQGSLDLVSAGASGLGGTAKAGLEKVGKSSSGSLVTNRKKIGQVGVNKVQKKGANDMTKEVKLSFSTGYKEDLKDVMYYYTANFSVKAIDIVEIIDGINTGITIGKETIHKVIEDCKNNEVFKASKDVAAGYTKYELQTNEEIYNDLSKYVSKTIKFK